MRKVSIAFAGAVAIVCAFSSASAQEVTNLDTAAWEAINKKIVDIYKGLDPKVPSVLAIHLMTVPKALPTDNVEAFRAAYLDIADTIPQWSPTWSPSNKFSSQYLLFAESISIPQRTDVKQADYHAAETEYTNITIQRNKAYGAVLKEWNEYRDGELKAHRKGLTWDQWLRELSVKGPTYKQLFAQRLKVQAKMYQLYDPGARVIGGFKERMLDYKFDHEEDRVDNVDRYPYNYTSARTALMQIAKDAQANQNATTPMFSWDGSKDTFRRSEERTSWGANASFTPFLGIFRVGASANGEHYSLDQSEGSAYVGIKAFGFGRVTIEPQESWYAPPLISWFKNNNGSFLPMPTPLLSQASLWGPNGSLNLRPIEMIVMVRPTLTAKLSKKDYKRVVDTLNAGGGVSFGPFSFGGRYSKTTETIDKNEEKGTITFTNASDTPYVIAVISQRL